MSPPPSQYQPETTQVDLATQVDLEREPLQPASKEHDPDMSTKGALNEDHLELRVGQDNQQRRSRGARVLSRGLKSIALFLVAFLAANGFWALFRPELYGHHGLISFNGKGDDHHKHRHHHHHHHRPDHPPPPRPPHGPPGRGPEHPPPAPPHGPPGHDHPHPPPPPPPHEPGHGPGGDRPGPPPPPPHKPWHGPGGDRPRPPGPPPPPHWPHDHPHPPRPPKVQECFDLVPGKTLNVRSSLKWAGQTVEVAPGLAGSSVTFVWDGKVGPPAPPRRGPHRGPPLPRPPRKRGETGEEDKEEAIENESESKKKERKKELGDVVFEVEVPGEDEWKAANISPKALRLCALQGRGVGIDIFNASGIPPSHAHIDPAFQQIAPSFNTTIYLPSHYARSPVRIGHP